MLPLGSLILTLLGLFYCAISGLCVWYARTVHAWVLWLFALEERSAEMTFVGEVQRHGYPVEERSCQTKDGYRLTLFRICHGLEDGEMAAGSRPVAFLQHGLLDDAFTWIVNGPRKSLAYILADAGYDVWMGNNRGTRYSEGHNYMKTTSRAYWNFTVDDFAMYDLPAMMECALSATGQSKLAYIGHSQGTTQAFAALAEQPSLGDKMNVFIGFGPVVTVGEMTNQVFTAMSYLYVDVFLNLFFTLTGQSKGLLTNPSPMQEKMLGLLCAVFPGLLGEIVQMICGPASATSIDKARTAEMAEHEPGGTSMMNLMHWAQAVRSGKFAKFDHGPSGNLARYGQSTAPEYDTGRWPKHLQYALFSGGNDTLADPQDVEALVLRMRKADMRVESAVMPQYNHLDFIWNTCAHIELYGKVMDIMEAAGAPANALKAPLRKPTHVTNDVIPSHVTNDVMIRTTAADCDDDEAARQVNGDHHESVEDLCGASSSTTGSDDQAKDLNKSWTNVYANAHIAAVS